MAAPTAAYKADSPTPCPDAVAMYHIVRHRIGPISRAVIGQ
jgi:hypothetical protein